MAKKTTVKAEISAEDIQKLAALKALDRAQSAITAQLSRKGQRIPPNSYAMDLAVKVCGDIVVAPDVETSGSEKPTDSASDLLTAIFAGLDQDEANTLMSGAMDRLKRAEESAKGKDELAAGEALLETTLTAHAKRRRRWRVTPAGYRAGATTGMPAVIVTGTVNGNAVEVEIDVAAAA